MQILTKLQACPVNCQCKRWQNPMKHRDCFELLTELLSYHLNTAAHQICEGSVDNFSEHKHYKPDKQHSKFFVIARF